MFCGGGPLFSVFNGNVYWHEWFCPDSLSTYAFDKGFRCRKEKPNSKLARIILRDSSAEEITTNDARQL